MEKVPYWIAIVYGEPMALNRFFSSLALLSEVKAEWVDGVKQIKIGSENKEAMLGIKSLAEKEGLFMGNLFPVKIGVNPSVIDLNRLPIEVNLEDFFIHVDTTKKVVARGA